MYKYLQQRVRRTRNDSNVRAGEEACQEGDVSIRFLFVGKKA